MDPNARRQCEISNALFARKRRWDSWCQDLANNYYPMRADFTQTLPEDLQTGTMESTPVYNRETLGNAVDSMLRQGQWFEVTTGDVDRDKQQDNALALAYATRKLRGIIGDRRSNFERATKEADQDWVTFGMPVLSVEYNVLGRHLVNRAWHPRDVATMQNSFGVIDTLHRKGTLTARDIEAKFKTKAWTGTLAPAIEAACRDQPFKEFNIRHVLMPADDYEYTTSARRPNRTAPLVSLYLDMDNQELLNEAPAKVFNYVVPRWRTLNNRPEGFSPLAVNSLADARMLQNMALVILEQGQKAVDPPIAGALEAFTREINLYAGGFTYIDLPEGRSLQDVMTTVDTSQGITIGVELKSDIRSMLAEGWLLNKLFLPDLREMTAYEASVRTEEFRRAALPFFTPIQSEYHSALLGVEWEMAVNVGLVDVRAFPPDLHGRDIVFQYTSPLEEAEGQQVVAAFQQSMAVVAAGAQVDQTVAQLFDVHQATVDAVRGSGAEPEWILPPDQLAAAKAKAAEDKQAADMAQKLAMGSQVATGLSGAAIAARQAGLVKGPPGAVATPAA